MIPGTLQRPGLLGKSATRSLQGGGVSCYRYRLTDPVLQASIRKYGILSPLVVSNAALPVVLEGHKRLHAAQALKLKEVPVLVAGKMDPRDAFLLNLISNWRGSCSDMDRAKALRMASEELGFKAATLLSELMPLLGLPEDRGTLELFLKLDQLPIVLKDLVESGQLPLRGAALLLKFSEADQVYFAQKIGTKMKLTSSQLLQAIEWLSDMLKNTGNSLEIFCRDHKILMGMNVPGMDLRTKADKLFARIKRLRFPNYSDYLEKFEEKTTGILHGTKGIRLEPIQGFEEPGFELHTRLKTPEELDLLLRNIAERRSALNSLFEIML